MQESDNIISPLDGRYKDKTKGVGKYFSEKSLMVACYEFECEWFKFIYPLLTRKGSYPKYGFFPLINEGDPSIYDKIKEKEKETKHDIKALELAIRDLIDEPELKEYVHIFLTSEDAKNIAYRVCIKHYLESHSFKDLLSGLDETIWGIGNIDTIFIARTHGQLAVPTTFKHQMLVYSTRILDIHREITHHHFSAKLGGAVGTMNSLYATVDNAAQIDDKIDEFVYRKFDMHRLQNTTQVNHNSDLSLLFSKFAILCSILLDLSNDMWYYTTLDIVCIKEGEGYIGSSTMPQKVNPIDFENAMGNLKLAQAIFNVFVSELPISKLQRDLSGSTIHRNIGVAFGYLSVALESIKTGMSKISVNTKVCEKELTKNYQIYSELLQTKLRLKGIPDSYVIINKWFKDKTKMSWNQWDDILIEFESLGYLTEKECSELTKIKPEDYIGSVNHKK